MAVFRRKMAYDFKEVTTVKPLNHNEVPMEIEQCRDPLFKPFASEIYTYTYNNFQPSNSKLMIGFKQAATRSPIFLINNSNAPFNGFGAEAIVNPPRGIKVHFPTISTNIDGTLNIEIKYDLEDPPPRPRSPPRLSPLRKRDDPSASRSHSSSPKRRRSSRFSPERPPKTALKRSSSGSEEEKPSTGRGVRRSQSVARELRPPPRASSKSRGRGQPKKKKSSASEEEEEKKKGGFFSLFG